MWPNPQFLADLVTFTKEIFYENFISRAVYWDFQNYKMTVVLILSAIKQKWQPIL